MTDALTYVNLQTGKVAFVNSREFDTRTSDPPHLRVPNSSFEWWAGFLDTYTGVRLREAERDSRIVGILQYGAGVQPASRYLVRWSGGPGFSYRLGKLEFTVDDKGRTHGAVVDLWTANAKESPSALSGFWITVSLLSRDLGDREARNVTLQIPVVADRVKAEGANLQAGWSLQPLATGN
jgi:hypothetical protein